MNAGDQGGNGGSTQYILSASATLGGLGALDLQFYTGSMGWIGPRIPIAFTKYVVPSATSVTLLQTPSGGGGGTGGGVNTIISQEITGGNPFLKEEESWGIDAAFEWYYDEASLFSVTVFHREIDNVISESNSKVDGSLYSDTAVAGELWDLAAFGNG